MAILLPEQTFADSVWFSLMEIRVILDFLGTVVRPPRGGFSSTVKGIRDQLVAHSRALYEADQRCPFAVEMGHTRAAEAAERAKAARRRGESPGS